MTNKPSSSIGRILRNEYVATAFKTALVIGGLSFASCEAKTQSVDTLVERSAPKPTQKEEFPIAIIMGVAGTLFYGRLIAREMANSQPYLSKSSNLPPEVIDGIKPLDW